MPYTPPSQRSPAASNTTTPTTSRRSSYQSGHGPSGPTINSRPELPRSASYMTRQHRRKNSAITSDLPPHLEITPPSTADNDEAPTHLKIPAGVRQSPPPAADQSKTPPGAIISPPDSAQNSSDDEESKLDGSRGRNLENLEELKAAIYEIEQRKEGSPSRDAKGALEPDDLGLIMPNTELNDSPVEIKNEPRSMPMHNRSKTETSIPMYFNQERECALETPLNGSEEELTDEDDETRSRRGKPSMVRKKSGELVRPALRPSSARRRPSSMPGTPTFSKAVHFDSHLEHVRHFLQVDRPLAVSAGSSPVESYDSDSEFPFNDGANSKEPSFEWEIVMSNFPADTPLRLSQPVRVERVFLSADNKTLIGTMAVANLAFNKWVVARFTLDYWKTTSEVVAEFNNDIRAPKHSDGHDRFNFNIKLADLANLEAKTMFFCVKYCVAGQEYWDNNNSTNYQIDFRKKAKPQNGKKGIQGASSRPAHTLPRSNKKPPIAGKPKPATFDDFGAFDDKYKFDDAGRDVDDYLGESTPIRLKGVKSAVALTSEGLRRSPHPNGQAFGNRYDFGASLSAAINAANSTLGDRSGITMKSLAKKSATFAQDDDEPSSPLTMTVAKSQKAPAKTQGLSNPAPPPSAEKPGLASQSYNELLDKYCFFGSVRSSPQIKDGTLKSGQIDGANDDGYITGSPGSSSESSPLMMEKMASPRIQPPAQVNRSTNPAPMTDYATGTSPMYPYQMHSFQFPDAHTGTAIRG
ncbi:putative phosphatase regulatory subunit-domain-containing protein [Calycina marina]|uniref:Phosphatase regulatory subunit-domain-containing protein n=1 Tax=Calycina marina TaxID=1763456 RepID=A0A9P7YY36_9HELO|nr:putative phosphatase regulatory subunit-domain-containing protein [Calycina marina]